MHCLSRASKSRGNSFTHVRESVNLSVRVCVNVNVNTNVKIRNKSHLSPSSKSSSPSLSPSSSKSSSPSSKFNSKSPSKLPPKSTSSSEVSPEYIAKEIHELSKRGEFISLSEVHRLMDMKELPPSRAQELVTLVKRYQPINQFLYISYLKACARKGDVDRVNQAARVCGVDVREWEGAGEIEGIERIMRVKALAVLESSVDVLLEAAQALSHSKTPKSDVYTEVIGHFTITKGTMEGLDLILKEMKNANVTMNEHGFRRYLRPLILARDFQACLREFHKLREQGLIVGDTGVSELITLFGNTDFGGITDLYLSEFVHPGKQPPREVYEALIRFYFARRDNATVLKLFNEATQNVELSAESFIKAFNACAWSKPEDLSNMKSYISSRYWMVDTHVFNSMLEAYRFMLDECLDLFNEMQQTNFGPNVVTYNIIINHFGRAQHLDAMVALFRTMLNNKIEPDAATYAHLIFWHSNAGAASSARELLEEAISKKISISVSTFGAFAEMCLAQGDEETCRKLTQQMVDNGMGEVAYQALLGKYSKEGNMEKASFILKELQKHGFNITPETHEVMLKSIISSGDAQKCKQFVAELDSQGIRLSGQVYSELLKFYAYQDIGLCGPLLHKMREWKLKPELPALEAILSVLLKTNKLEECRKVFESIRNSYIRPSTTAYNFAMSAAGKMGDLAYCEQLLEEMRKSGPFPDRYTYNTILSYSSRARDAALIAKFRDKMKQDGIPPTVVAYGILITSASRQFDVEGALKLFEEMKSNHVLPDEIIFHDLMLLLLRANDHELVMNMYAEMKGCGFVPQLRLYTLLLRHMAALKKYDICKELMQEMYNNGVAPDEKLLSIMKMVVDDAKRDSFEDETNTEDNSSTIVENETSSSGLKEEMEEKGGVFLCTEKEKEEEKEKEKETDNDKENVTNDVQVFFKMCTT